MPTETHPFISTQGALTLFFNLINSDSRESSPIITYMEKAFPSQQFIYNKVAKLPNCDTILDEIMMSRENMDIILPSSKRLVFCFYIDLKDFSKDFVDQFYQIAIELRKRQPLNHNTDQHYVVCFRFKVAQMETCIIEEKASLINELVNRDHSVSKEIFMLRTTALESFENQERGLVESLYLQSRENNTDYMASVSANRSALRMVVYEDYYMNRNAMCQEAIARIDEWLTVPSDKDLLRLKDSIQEEVLKALAEMRTITRSFGRISTLYPVNKEDFDPVKTLGIFITGYTSKFGRNHPILVERRKKMIEDKQDSLIDRINMTSISEVIVDTYHYPDLIKLIDVDSKEYSENVVHDVLLDQRQRLPEEEEFVRTITNVIMEKIKDMRVLKTLDDPENGLKIKKERERRLYQKELLKAGVYNNLEECFDLIDRHARPSLINGMFAELSYQRVLINDKCHEKLQSYPAGIRGINDAYNHSEIEPCEIVLTRVFNMVELRGNEAMENLCRVLQ